MAREIGRIEARRAVKANAQLAAAKAMTFEECAMSYIKAHKVGWKSPKNLAPGGRHTRRRRIRGIRQSRGAGDRYGGGHEGEQRPAAGADRQRAGDLPVDAAQLAHPRHGAGRGSDIAFQYAGIVPTFPGPGGGDFPASPRQRSGAPGARHLKKAVAIFSKAPG